MRWVWVVIPLVLFSVIGIQESFADTVIEKISSEMELSNIPKLGETAQLTLTTSILSHLSDDLPSIIEFTIPPGFELLDAESFTIDGEYTKYGVTSQRFIKNVSISDFDDDFTITSIITIKAIQTGTWILGHHISELIIVVGEDESYLVPNIQSLPPQVVVPEPPPKPTVIIHPSPKKQLESGIASENIICKEGLELILKSSDNSPACVKPQTAEKLIERGWTTTHLDKQKLIQGNIIKYAITGDAIITDIINDQDAHAMIIQVYTVTASTLTIEIPRDLLDTPLCSYNNANYNENVIENDKFLVLIDGEEINHEEIKTTHEKRTLLIPFHENSKEIEILTPCVI